MKPLIPDLPVQMRGWRHAMHQRPEIGFDVYETADKVAANLRNFGLEVHTGIGRSGVVGVLRKGNSDQAIGLRADMDALLIQEENTFAHRSINDGCMHACGHDGHSAMLLGAAKQLAEEGIFDGTVFFIFQPAEESGLGAQAMIDDGLFERFPMSAVYGMHNMPGKKLGTISTRPGPFMASEDTFAIEVQGKGGHASQPHQGIDSMLIATFIVQSIQAIVSRNIDPMETATVSVTQIAGDGLSNVIPNRVTIKGDCRCFSHEVRDLIERRLEEISAGICSAHGAVFSFQYNRSCPATINTSIETAAAVTAAETILNECDVDGNAKAETISEDFACMLQAKPGCYVLIGNGADSVGGCKLHTPDYDFNDELPSIGAAYWSTLVEQQLPTNGTCQQERTTK